MATYYEILKITSSATVSEIETAIDGQYNQYRRLVTHHDPNIVNQANQALTLLEQIRATLLDSARRDGYDTAIGVKGQHFGGLIDPEMLLKTATVIAPLSAPATSAQPVVRVDAWLCPKCQHPNAVGTQFCAQDGYKIGHNCPGCGKLTQLSNNFCPYCGIDKVKQYEENRTAEIVKAQKSVFSIKQRLAIYENVSNGWWGPPQSELEKKILMELRKANGCSASVTALISMIGGVIVGYMIGATTNDGTIQFLLIMVGLFAGIFLADRINQSSARNAAKNDVSVNIKKVKEQIRELEQQIQAQQSRTYPE